MIKNRIVSSLLLITFVSTNHLVNPAYAAKSAAAPAAVSHSFPANPEEVQIPSELGKIQESFKGMSDETVVLVQDAHAIPDAQRNIQKLIEHLQKEYGLGVIAVEGAASQLDPQIFRSFPDKEMLKKIFEGYLEQGELTGTTAAAIFNKKEAVYQGVEDWSLYEEGLGLYLKALEKDAEISEKTAALKADMQKEKESVYSEDLLQIDRALENFHANHGGLTEIVQKLAALQAPEKGSELELFLTEIRNEEKAPAVDQRPAALRRLHERSERLRDIEGTKFLRDFEAYAQEVKNSLFKNEAGRKLDQESRKLALLERLTKLELNREDWKEIKNVTSDTTPVTGKSLDLSAHFSFYKNAQAREEAFLKNLDSLMKERHAKASLLVAGGFHAEGLTQRLKEKGISYLLVMPQISSVPENSRYRELMSGSVSWKNYFRVEGGQVNLYKAFVRATRDKLLSSSSPNILKDWRDQIIRDLARKEKIAGVGRYTSLIDEKNPRISGRAEWQLKVERFIDGLRKLDAAKQLTGPNVMRLLQPATMQVYALANAIVPGAEINDADILSISRAEVRTEGETLRLSSSDELRKYFEAHPKYQVSEKKGVTVWEYDHSNNYRAAWKETGGKFILYFPVDQFNLTLEFGENGIFLYLSDYRGTFVTPNEPIAIANSDFIGIDVPKDPNDAPYFHVRFQALPKNVLQEFKIILGENWKDLPLLGYHDQKSTGESFDLEVANIDKYNLLQPSELQNVGSLRMKVQGAKDTEYGIYQLFWPTGPSGRTFAFSPEGDILMANGYSQRFIRAEQPLKVVWTRGEKYGYDAVLDRNHNAVVSNVDWNGAITVLDTRDSSTVKRIEPKTYGNPDSLAADAQGDILIAGEGKLWKIRASDYGYEDLMMEGFGRIKNITVGPDGTVYLLNDPDEDWEQPQKPEGIYVMQSWGHVELSPLSAKMLQYGSPVSLAMDKEGNFYAAYGGWEQKPVVRIFEKNSGDLLATLDQFPQNEHSPWLTRDPQGDIVLGLYPKDRALEENRRHIYRIEAVDKEGHRKWDRIALKLRAEDPAETIKKSYQSVDALYQGIMRKIIHQIYSWGSREYNWYDLSEDEKAEYVRERYPFNGNPSVDSKIVKAIATILIEFKAKGYKHISREEIQQEFEKWVPPDTLKAIVFYILNNHFIKKGEVFTAGKIAEKLGTTVDLATLMLLPYSDNDTGLIEEGIVELTDHRPTSTLVIGGPQPVGGTRVYEKINGRDFGPWIGSAEPKIEELTAHLQSVRSRAEVRAEGEEPVARQMAEETSGGMVTVRYEIARRAELKEILDFILKAMNKTEGDVQSMRAELQSRMKFMTLSEETKKEPFSKGDKLQVVLLKVSSAAQAGAADTYGFAEDRPVVQEKPGVVPSSSMGETFGLVGDAKEPGISPEKAPALKKAIEGILGIVKKNYQAGIEELKQGTVQIFIKNQPEGTVFRFSSAAKTALATQPRPAGHELHSLAEELQPETDKTNVGPRIAELWETLSRSEARAAGQPTAAELGLGLSAKSEARADVSKEELIEKMTAATGAEKEEIVAKINRLAKSTFGRVYYSFTILEYMIQLGFFQGQGVEKLEKVTQILEAIKDPNVVGEIRGLFSRKFFENQFMEKLERLVRIAKVMETKHLLVRTAPIEIGNQRGMHRVVDLPAGALVFTAIRGLSEHNFFETDALEKLERLMGGFQILRQLAIEQELEAVKKIEDLIFSPSFKGFEKNEDLDRLFAKVIREINAKENPLQRLLWTAAFTLGIGVPLSIAAYFLILPEILILLVVPAAVDVFRWIRNFRLKKAEKIWASRRDIVPVDRIDDFMVSKISRSEARAQGLSLLIAADVLKVLKKKKLETFKTEEILEAYQTASEALELTGIPNNAFEPRMDKPRGFFALENALNILVSAGYLELEGNEAGVSPGSYKMTVKASERLKGSAVENFNPEFFFGAPLANEQLFEIFKVLAAGYQGQSDYQVNISKTKKTGSVSLRRNDSTRNSWMEIRLENGNLSFSAGAESNVISASSSDSISFGKQTTETRSVNTSMRPASGMFTYSGPNPLRGVAKDANGFVFIVDPLFLEVYQMDQDGFSPQLDQLPWRIASDENTSSLEILKLFPRSEARKQTLKEKVQTAKETIGSLLSPQENKLQVLDLLEQVIKIVETDRKKAALIIKQAKALLQGNRRFNTPVNPTSWTSALVDVDSHRANDSEGVIESKRILTGLRAAILRAEKKARSEARSGTYGYRLGKDESVTIGRISKRGAGVEEKIEAKITVKSISSKQVRLQVEAPNYRVFTENAKVRYTGKSWIFPVSIVENWTQSLKALEIGNDIFISFTQEPIGENNAMRVHLGFNVPGQFTALNDLDWAQYRTRVLEAPSTGSRAARNLLLQLIQKTLNFDAGKSFTIYQLAEAGLYKRSTKAAIHYALDEGWLEAALGSVNLDSRLFLSATGVRRGTPRQRSAPRREVVDAYKITETGKAKAIELRDGRQISRSEARAAGQPTAAELGLGLSAKSEVRTDEGKLLTPAMIAVMFETLAASFTEKRKSIEATLEKNQRERDRLQQHVGQDLERLIALRQIIQEAEGIDSRYAVAAAQLRRAAEAVRSLPNLEKYPDAGSWLDFLRGFGMDDAKIHASFEKAYNEAVEQIQKIQPLLKPLQSYAGLQGDQNTRLRAEAQKHLSALQSGQNLRSAIGDAYLFLRHAWWDNAPKPQEDPRRGPRFEKEDVYGSSFLFEKLLPQAVRDGKEGFLIQIENARYLIWKDGKILAAKDGQSPFEPLNENSTGAFKSKGVFETFFKTFRDLLSGKTQFDEVDLGQPFFRHAWDSEFSNPLFYPSRNQMQPNKFDFPVIMAEVIPVLGGKIAGIRLVRVETEGGHWFEGSSFGKEQTKPLPSYLSEDQFYAVIHPYLPVAVAAEPSVPPAPVQAAPAPKTENIFNSFQDLFDFAGSGKAPEFLNLGSLRLVDESGKFTLYIPGIEMEGIVLDKDVDSIHVVKPSTLEAKTEYIVTIKNWEKVKIELEKIARQAVPGAQTQIQISENGFIAEDAKSKFVFRSATSVANIPAPQALAAAEGLWKKSKVIKVGEEVNDVAISADGKIVMTVHDGAVRLWDAETGKRFKTFQDSQDSIGSAALSGDGSRLLTQSSISLKLKLRDVQTGKTLRTFNKAGKVFNSFALSPDGKSFVFMEDDAVTLFDAETGNMQWSQRISAFQTRIDFPIVFLADGRIVTVTDDRIIQIFAQDGVKLRTLTIEQKEYRSFAISPDGKTIVTGDRGGTVQLWDAETGKKIWVLKENQDSILPMVFSPDSKRIVMGNEDNSVTVWDAETGQEIQTLKEHLSLVMSIAGSAQVMSIAISADGTRMVAGSEDKTVRVWQYYAVPPAPLTSTTTSGVVDIRSLPGVKVELVGNQWQITIGNQTFEAAVGKAGLSRKIGEIFGLTEIPMDQYHFGFDMSAYPNYMEIYKTTVVSSKDYAPYVENLLRRILEFVPLKEAASASAPAPGVIPLNAFDATDLLKNPLAGQEGLRIGPFSFVLKREDSNMKLFAETGKGLSNEVSQVYVVPADPATGSKQEFFVMFKDLESVKQEIALLPNVTVIQNEAGDSIIVEDDKYKLVLRGEKPVVALAGLAPAVSTQAEKTVSFTAISEFEEFLRSREDVGHDSFEGMEHLRLGKTDFFTSFSKATFIQLRIPTYFGGFEGAFVDIDIKFPGKEKEDVEVLFQTQDARFVEKMKASDFISLDVAGEVKTGMHFTFRFKTFPETILKAAKQAGIDLNYLRLSNGSGDPTGHTAQIEIVGQEEKSASTQAPEQGVPSASARDLAGRIVKAIREGKVKDFDWAAAVAMIKKFGVEIFIGELQAAGLEAADEQDVAAGANAQNYFAAIQKIDRLVVIEHVISEQDLARMENNSEAIIAELLQAAHDASASNKYVVSRIRVPRAIQDQLKLKDHNQRDSVRVEKTGNTMTFYNKALPQYEQIMSSPNFHDAATITVSDTPNIQGTVLLSDRYGDDQNIQYQGADRTKVASRIFAAALVWAAESISERTFAGLVQADNRADGYRIVDQNALNALGAFVQIMAQYRSELRIAQAA